MPDLQTCIPTDFTFQQIECIVLNVGTDNASPQMKVVYRDFLGGFSPRSKKDLRTIIPHYFVRQVGFRNINHTMPKKPHPIIFSAVFMNLGIIFVSDDWNSNLFSLCHISVGYKITK